MSKPVVVSDAGPLTALAGCGQLELLTAVFEGLHVPQAVLDETTADRSRPGAADVAAFVQAHARVHPARDDDIYAAAASYLDEGEAQALSLAHALGCGVLIDERRGRQAALRQGVPLFGVLGVLLQTRRICVFRPIVTGRSGIVTADSGIVTGRSGDVTEGCLEGFEGCV